MQVIGDESSRAVALVNSKKQKHLIDSIIGQSTLLNRPLRINCLYPETGLDLASAISSATDIIVCHHFSPDTPWPVIPNVSVRQRVIVLSDCEDENSIVRTLLQGAHHFFNINEPVSLLATRIQAALRRYRSLDKRILNFAPYTFCMSARQVALGGELIPLNPKEFDCAYYLFANQNRVVTVEELMVSVWSLPAKLDSRRIDTAACRLRKKMSLNEEGNGWYLERVRGTGFKLINEKSNIYSVA